MGYYLSGLLILTMSCVTPSEEAERDFELKKLGFLHNSKMCRVACDNAMKSFNPLTGECKCYPPEYMSKKRKRSRQ